MGSEQVDLVGYEEACRLTGLKRGTLYSKVAKSEVPHYRLGNRLVLFSVEELKRWLKEKHVAVGACKMATK